VPSLDNRFPIYSKVIKLFPPKYYKEYGRQILQTTADMLDNAPSSGAKLVIWTKLAIDLPINITKQQLQYSGGIYMKETPTYVKISGILTGILLLPFFVALIANGLDKVINNHTLYNSWVWRYDFLRVWVLILPIIAVIVALVSLAVYVARSPENRPKQLLGRVFDIKHNWPIVATGLVALGILFILRYHDSAKCLIQIPRHFLSHNNQSQVCKNYNFITNGPIPTVPTH